MLEASIIIPSYKQLNHCSEAMTSIISNTLEVDYEIIVVNDDHKEDELGKFLQNLYLKGLISLVKLFGGNHGHRVATQAGIDIAIGEHLVFVNDDVIIPNESKKWLRILIDYLKSNPTVASVTPASYHSNNTVYWIGITKYPPPKHNHLHKPKGHPDLPLEAVETRFNNMACFVTRKWYWDNGYGWNELCSKEINHYGSDSCWSFGITTTLKLKHICLPKVWVYHHNAFYKRI